MKKVIYLLASAIGGAAIGSLLYVFYSYIQLITVGDDVVEGLVIYQAIGAVIGFTQGRWWQTHYKYWYLLEFSPQRSKHRLGR